MLIRNIRQKGGHNVHNAHRKLCPITRKNTYESMKYVEKYIYIYIYIYIYMKKVQRKKVKDRM